MLTLEGLLALAEAAGLAGVEKATSYGSPSLVVRGKFLARIKDESVLVVRCPIDEKEMLMAAEPELYFETEHYKGWPAVLMRLEVADKARITARLERAWEMHATKRMIAART